MGAMEIQEKLFSKEHQLERVRAEADRLADEYIEARIASTKRFLVRQCGAENEAWVEDVLGRLVGDAIYADRVRG